MADPRWHMFENSGINNMTLQGASDNYCFSAALILHALYIKQCRRLILLEMQGC